VFRVHQASQEVLKQLELETPPEITAIAVNGGIGIGIGGGGTRDARVFGGFPSNSTYVS
jgi:hypothetical protein